MFVTDYTKHLLDHVKKIHFIGCGGSGMYPLIQILNAKGYVISGMISSDDNLRYLYLSTTQAFSAQKMEKLPAKRCSLTNSDCTFY